MGFFDKLTRRSPAKPGQAQASAYPPAADGEVRPPWVEYPGIPPWDFFWREAGEPWRTLVWEPYDNTLGAGEQAGYLQRWHVPQDWQDSYFDQSRRDFWDHVDDPE